jgi:hypothetical protein
METNVRGGSEEGEGYGAKEVGEGGIRIALKKINGR